MQSSRRNYLALAPIGIFLALYLGLGILLEYVLAVPMGFYRIPVVVAFLVAIGAACLQNRARTFEDKLQTMASGMGHPTIITMILIFLLAGVFVGTVGRSSAESVAYFMLSFIPAQYAVAVLFAVACFVSLAMGTSCGTIALIAPIAVAVSGASGFDMALCLASVMAGAMFGDNLSFISDTTIAACTTQKCGMRDKFRTNFKIALPAAAASVALYLFATAGQEVAGGIDKPYSFIELIPYILVLTGGLAGINVFIVLVIGIVSGAFITLASSGTAPLELMAAMGSGAAGSFETSMVALLVAAMCALIRENGGFDALLAIVYSSFKGKTGGKFGIGLLVGAMDVATANNTVAIVMAGPIASEMRERYGISAKKAASILDTWSCIFQGVIPYGAQMLYTVGAAATLGFTVSAFDVIAYLYYPVCLLVSSAASFLLSRAD